MIASLHDLRLLVVADDPLARAGLAGLLAAQPGCQIVGQSVADSDWPVELASAQPDVIVWDLGWTAGNSLERLAELSDTTPPILALLPEADADAGTAVSAWRAGARGLLIARCRTGRHHSRRAKPGRGADRAGPRSRRRSAARRICRAFNRCTGRCPDAARAGSAPVAG